MLQKDVWEDLSLYESVDLVRSKYEAKFGREMNSSKSFEVSSFISQGREYFHSASTASRLVKPLLLYYGVLALSRGLILFRSPTYREASLAQSHGLTTVGWGQTLSQGTNHLPLLAIRTQGSGTLSQLIEIQKIRKWVFQDLGGVYLARPLTMDSLNWSASFTITLENLLSRFPDLVDIYMNTMQKNSNVRSAWFALDFPSALNFSDFGERASLAMSIRDLDRDDTEELKGLLPMSIVEGIRSDQVFCGRHLRILSHIIDFKFASPDQIKDIILSLEGFEEPTSIEDLEKSTEGHFIFKLKNGEQLSDLTRVFCLSYILGMLVRYNPSTWASLMSKRAGDRYLPILRSATDLIEREFPNLILRQLLY